MRIFSCSICAYPVYPGHGITFVRNDSKTFRFCSSKCRHVFEKKANPRKIKWTKAYRRVHNKELTMDTTFDFEQQRNRPPKYDRELYAQTIQAIKRVAQLQERRQRDFYFKRMKSSLKHRKMHLLQTVQKHIHLIKAPQLQKKELLQQQQQQQQLLQPQQIQQQVQQQQVQKQVQRKKVVQKNLS